MVSKIGKGLFNELTKSDVFSVELTSDLAYLLDNGALSANQFKNHIAVDITKNMM